MAITINGSGTITGITAGGYPDATVTADDLAATLDLSGKTVTLPSGTGGKILKVVRTNYDTTTSLSVSSTINDVPGVSVSIVPASSSSRFIISGVVNGEWANVAYNWNSGVVIGRLISGTSTWIVPDSYGSRIPGLTIPKLTYYNNDDGSTPEGWTIANYVDAPATTGTITYRFGMSCGDPGATFYVNRTVTDSNNTDYNRFRSWISVIEVAD